MRLIVLFYALSILLPFSCYAMGGQIKDEVVTSDLTAFLSTQIDPTWKVQIEPYSGIVDREKSAAPFKWRDSHRIKIGGGAWLQITVQSNRQGYLYLISKPASSSDFEVIYPVKKEDAPKLVAPGVPFIIPRRWPALGNDGKPEKNSIYAILSKNPVENFTNHFRSGIATPSQGQFQSNSAKSPCKALGVGVDTCGATSPTKRLGAGISTEKHESNKIGVGKLILDEY